MRTSFLVVVNSNYPFDVDTKICKLKIVDNVRNNISVTSREDYNHFQFILNSCY